jgi:rubrerythrin
MSEDVGVTVREAIEFAVATEEMGVRAYCRLAEKFSQRKEISEAFSLLAKDEKAHKAQFQALLADVPPYEGVMTKEERSRYLRAMAMSEFFRGDAGLIGKLDKAESLGQALIDVLGFEKATLAYYLAVKDVVGKCEALEKIIQAEKGHILALMKYVVTEGKMRGLADTF